jgi:hypothetical protein
MFDIDFLLIKPLSEQLEKIEDYREKAEFLFKVIEFDKFFSQYSEKIRDCWNRIAEEKYITENYIISRSDRLFIADYAYETRDILKVKDLINKLCNLSDGVYDYDEVIATAENEIAVIRNIDDFEFTDTAMAEEKAKPKKTKLDTLLKFKPNN